MRRKRITPTRKRVSSSSNMASLFGNNSSSRNQSKYLVEFRAGKMHLKGKMVNPDKRKGMVYIHQSDDSLMHFCWKDRSTGSIEDDLIIFPDDIEFKPVSQCTTGRVYVLKFKSSSRKFFFWMQEPKTDKDEEYCKKVNDFLNNPPTARSGRNGGGLGGIPDLGSLGADSDLQGLLGNMSQQQLMQLLGGMGMGGLGNMSSLMGSPSSRSQSATPSGAGGSSSSSGHSSAPAQSIATPTPVESTTPALPATPATSADKTPSGDDKEGPKIQLSDLQSILSNMAVPADAKDSVDFSKALTPEAMISVLTKPEAEKKLLEFLPEAENLPRTAQELRNTVQSPQFQQALSTFSAALGSGQLGPLMSQFGFSQDVVLAASQGDVDGFVRAMEAEENADVGEKMDEDEK